MPTEENRNILYLKISLILILSVISVYILYLAAFVPETQTLNPINMKPLPVGEWRQFQPFETFRSGPKLLQTSIQKDSSAKKFIRIKTLNEKETYSGAIFHIKRPVPRNTSLVMQWRSSGSAPSILIDVMDGSRGAENKGDIGENFDVEYPVPGNNWKTINIPLDTLELNTYQVAGKKLDGIFNFNEIRRVSLTFYPTTDITLDVSDLHFVWSTEKWTIASLLFAMGLIGFLLLYRTKPENLFLEGGSSLRTNALISRVTYCLVALSAVVAAFLQGPDFLYVPTLSTYGALLVLILVEEFTSVFQQNPVWSLRYATILFGGYHMDFGGGILSVSLLLMASYVPVILEKMRMIFWALAIAAVVGYVSEPMLDSHFPFLTGLIFIFCCSAIAVVIREFLQQQQADYLAEKAILQYEALFKQTSDAIYLVDQNGKIETVNNGFERLTGYSLNEVKGKYITDLITPKGVKIIKEMLADIENNDAKQYDIHFVHKDGDHRAALVRCSPNYKHKKFSGYMALATDITERKNAEEKLKLYAELQEKTASELAALNEQLKVSEYRLRELNAGKDKFFSIISHDLKNPFSSLLGFSDMIVKDYDSLSDDEIKMFSSNINGSLRNLYNLLDNLLQWATLRTGKMEYSADIIKLHGIVENAIGVVNTSAQNKDISIFNDTEKGTLLYADFNSVNSVLQNLMTNAIKFTHTGGEIHISSRKLSESVEITVIDNGVGMTPEVLDKLFRIDVQHSTQGTSKEKGTGLGLILCKEMIENNGGTIRVESEPGKGSRFIFTLPEFIQAKSEQLADKTAQNSNLN